MPAEQAGDTASPVTTEATEAQTTEATSVATEQTLPLQYKVGDVIDKLGLPAEVRKQFTDEATAEAEPEVKPAESSTPEVQPPVKEGEEPEAKKEAAEGEKTEEGEQEEPEQSEEEHAPPEAKKLLKRIDKLTAQRRRAEERAVLVEEENEQLKAQLQESPPVVAGPSAADPLAHITQVSQLNQVYSEWKLARDWARKHPDGVVLNEGKENERTVTREEMVDTLSTAEDMINDYIPQKRVALQAAVQFDSAARQLYPNLFDRNHPDHQVARAALSELPSVASHPARNLFTGDYLLGAKIRTTGLMPQVLALLEKAGSKNGTTKQESKTENELDERILAPKPPIAEHTPNPPSRTHVPSTRKKIEEAYKRFIETGFDDRALIEVIKARMEARAQKTGREPVKV